jgi:hypothetical protein
MFIETNFHEDQVELFMMVLLFHVCGKMEEIFQILTETLVSLKQSGDEFSLKHETPRQSVICTNSTVEFLYKQQNLNTA